MPTDPERARAAYDRRQWKSAYGSFVAADKDEPLEAEDLFRHAMSAYFIGFDDDCIRALERAHHAHVEASEDLRAVRCAFWLGMRLAARGEFGPAMGWFARGQRVLGSHDECVEHGYLLLPQVMQHRMTGSYQDAYDTAALAVELGTRFREADLLAFAVYEQGHALLKLGRVADGLALMDEAMVAVTSGELTPLVTGLIYCSVIAGCCEVLELRRAREWTAALARWCEEQPDLVTFAGQCLVHRSQLMRIDGSWTEALQEAKAALERIERGADQQAAGAAHLERAETQRLRGEFEEAEAAYRRATEWGLDPQPGLGLLRLAQGQTGTALAGIERALSETSDPPRRAILLSALVEAAHAAGDAQRARDRADELLEIAERLEVLALTAMAAQARGSVELAERQSTQALGSLREAWKAWHELDAPYDAARVRVGLARCCGELGDSDSATLELEAARQTFERLGAVSDLAALGRSGPPDHPLTPRELEVLHLVAGGKTNKAIASALVVSERTIDRHVSNILTKFGVPSRAAAIAYAYEHELI